MENQKILLVLKGRSLSLAGPLLSSRPASRLCSEFMLLLNVLHTFCGLDVVLRHGGTLRGIWEAGLPPPCEGSWAVGGSSSYFFCSLYGTL